MRTRRHRSGRPAGAAMAPALSTAPVPRRPWTDASRSGRSPHHLRSRPAMSLSCRQEKVFCGRARNRTPAPRRPPSADMLRRRGGCRGDAAGPLRRGARARPERSAARQAPQPRPSPGRPCSPPSLCCLLTKSLRSTPVFSPLFLSPRWEN